MLVYIQIPYVQYITPLITAAWVFIIDENDGDICSTLDVALFQVLYQRDIEAEVEMQREPISNFAIGQFFLVLCESLNAIARARTRKS